MAHYNGNVRGINQSSGSNQRSFHYLSSGLHTAYDKGGNKKMAQFKIAWLIADLLGFSSAFLGWINNLDNVKSAVLFIIGSVYMMARTYFYIRRGNNQIRKEKWEQGEREKKKVG